MINNKKQGMTVVQVSAILIALILLAISVVVFLLRYNKKEAPKTKVNGRSICYRDISSNKVKQLIIYYDDENKPTSITKDGCASDSKMKEVVDYKVVIIGAGGGGSFPKVKYNFEKLGEDFIEINENETTIKNHFFEEDSKVFSKISGANAKFANYLNENCYISLALKNNTCPFENEKREHKIAIKQGDTYSYSKEENQNKLEFPTIEGKQEIILSKILDKAEERFKCENPLKDSYDYISNDSLGSALIKFTCENKSVAQGNKVKLEIGHLIGNISQRQGGGAGEVQVYNSVTFPTDVIIGEGGMGGVDANENCFGKEGGETSIVLDGIERKVSGGVGASCSDKTNDIVLEGNSRNNIKESKVFPGVKGEKPRYTLNQDLVHYLYGANTSFGAGGASGKIDYQALPAKYQPTDYLKMTFGKDDLYINSFNSGVLPQDPEFGFVGEKGHSGAIVVEW